MTGKRFRIDAELFLVGCVVVAIVLGWIGLARSQSGALVAALMLGILSLVTVDIAWTLDFRRAPATEPSEGKTKEDLEREQVRFNALLRPLSIFIGGLAFVFLTAWVVITPPMPAPEWLKWAYCVLGAVLVLGVVLWWLGPRVVTDVEPTEQAMADAPYTRWTRFTAIVLWLTIPSYVASVASENNTTLAFLRWFVQPAGILAFLVAVELTVRAGWSLIAPKTRALPEAPLPTSVGSWLLAGAERLIPWGPSRPRPVATAGDTRLVWLKHFLQGSLPRVLIGLIVILWLTTAFTQVGVNEQGVRERLGRATTEVLEPGIHLGWPWPIDRVLRFQTRKLQVLQIGYTTEQVERKRNLIWTEAHGIEEDRFVTAYGSEVISFDIDVYYRISDVLKYAYSYQNPETILRDIAYQAIMLRTHATDTDTLLSRDRAALAEGLRKDIQANCDAADIGIDVPQVAIIAIHPPFEVAAAYQSVVSAQVRRDTLTIQASTYMEEIIPTARAQAQTILDSASAYAVERVALARGEAAGFTLLWDVVRTEPLVYRFRRQMETLETGLPDKRLYVVSGDFLVSEDGGEDSGIWFDLR